MKFKFILMAKSDDEIIWPMNSQFNSWSYTRSTLQKNY